MRVVGLVLIVSGCGRIGFDAVETTNLVCPGNLIVDPTFELGDPLWRADGDSMFTFTADAHAGASAGAACRLPTAGAFDYSIRTTVMLPDTAIGARYRMTAWVRLTLGTSGGLEVRLRTATDQLEAQLSTVPLDATWQQIDFEYAVGVAGGVEAFAEIYGSKGPGDPSYCVEADDVCFAAIPGL